MAITTLDGIIAGARPPIPIFKSSGTTEFSGIWHTLFYAAGSPGLAIAPTPGMAGGALTTYAGQIPWTNPAGGLNTHLSRLSIATTVIGTFALRDRLWHNSGIVVTTTTIQTIGSVAWPARDSAGTTLGEGVQIGLEVSTSTTNASGVTTITMGYTNSLGVAGRVGTIPSFPATAVAGTTVAFQLQAGDTGVRSIQDITLGTSLLTGVVHLVARREVAQLALPTANVAAEINAVTGGFPRLWNDSVLTMAYLPTGTTGANLFGTVAFAQG